MCMIKTDNTPRSYIGYKLVQKTPEGKYKSPVQGYMYRTGYVNKDVVMEDWNCLTNFYPTYSRYKGGFFFFRTLRATRKAQNAQHAVYFRSRPATNHYEGINIVCVQCRYWGVTESGTDEVGEKTDRALFFEIIREVTLK